MTEKDRTLIIQRHEIGKLAQERTELRKAIARICELIEDAAEAEESPESVHVRFAEIIKELEK